MQLRKIAILMIIFSLFIAYPLYAQEAKQAIVNEVQPPVIVPITVDDSAFVTGADVSLRVALQNQKHYIYWSWLNSKDFARSYSQENEKIQLRRQWQDLLGVDVFMPYFKVKEAEDFISNKTKVSVFDFKGKAHFNESKKQVEYIFKKRF